MKRIEGILLDFGGTLDSDGIYWYDLFYKISREQGLELGRAAFEQEAQAAGSALSLHRDIRRISHEETVSRLFCELGKRLSGHFTLDASLATGKFFEHCQPWLETNLDVVRKLSEHFLLGVVSNNWGNARGWCAHYGFLPYLKTVVDSALVGVSKPRPAIFELGLKELGLPAAGVAYVGDRYHTDMVGARNAGLATVWVRHAESQEQMEDGVVDFVIPSLPALLTIAREHWLDGKGES